ncbi:MAG: VWA domain-containing protein [Myxococcaceae bacterium]
MDARIVEFAEVLRQNGLRVSTSEVQDAERAAELVGLSDPGLFKSALRSSLCKRELDVETFDRCFTFYFSGASRTFDAIDEALRARIDEEGLIEGDDLKMIIATLEQLVPGMSPLAQATLEGDRARLAQLFRAAALQIDLSRMETAFQTGFFSRRMLSGAGSDKAYSDLRSLEEELKARGVSADGVEVVSRYVGDAMRKVEEAARAEIARQAQARTRRMASSVVDRSFNQLSRNEIEAAQSAVRKMAEKLKTRLQRKQRTRKKGALHVRRTLRKNMPWGGVPMVPQFRNKRPERPDVVVLCDVSDSVRNASRMMLLFTHTLQTLFSRVRSFVFVSDIGEVTEYFRELEPEEAIDVAVAGKGISLASNSNYGRALAMFVRDNLGSITRRTTVMVIGDGRNNFNPPNAWALKELKRKAKRVVWIATEDRRSWGFGDSEMHTYSKNVDQAVVVQSVADLDKVADQLVAI